MNAKFYELKKEKQDRIINGALKVFALRGYRHASTDVIVQEAGISKGLLFHYFGSKIGLYSFLYEYSARFMMMELTACVDERERDMFLLMMQSQRAAMQLMKVYPYMQQFLERCEREDVSEALLATEEKKEELRQLLRRIERQADMSLFPDHVDSRKVRKIMELAVKGLIAEHFEHHSFQPQMVYEELTEYLSLMRRIVYRED